jgi:hypothetical protein
MYFRMSQGNVDPSRLDEYLAYGRSALPALSQLRGFKNAIVGVNRANARSVIVTTWDTEGDANYKAPPEGIARLQTVGLQPESIMVFEVTDQI